MKLDELCETTILSVFKYKNINKLNKLPKKKKKNVYGVGGLYHTVNMDGLVNGGPVVAVGGDGGSGGDGGGGGGE